MGGDEEKASKVRRTGMTVILQTTRMENLNPCGLQECLASKEKRVILAQKNIGPHHDGIYSEGCTWEPFFHHHGLDSQSSLERLDSNLWEIYVYSGLC